MATITCIDCGTAAERASKVAKRCLPCAHLRDRQIAQQCAARRKAGIPSRPHKSPGERWSTFGAHGVAFGKSIGLLPQLDGSIPCVDCGEPADRYDHRDYARPLDVDAVCITCNSRRGPARIPASLQELKAA